MVNVNTKMLMDLSYPYIFITINRLYDTEHGLYWSKLDYKKSRVK